MSEIVISIPDTSEIERSANGIVGRAQAIIVSTPQDFVSVVEFVRDCKTKERSITGILDPIIKNANDTHKSLTGLRNKLMAPWSEARTIADRKAIEWEDEQRRIEEQARLAAEAEARKAEEDRLLAEAALAEDAGDTETAEAILSEPVAPPPVVLPTAIPKVEGSFTRSTWSAEVTDMAKLILWVADELKAGRGSAAAYLSANESNLRRAAQMQHEALRIPGVRAIETKSRTTRT